MSTEGKIAVNEITQAQFKLLRSIEAWIEVWVNWSTDQALIQRSRLWQEGSFNRRTCDILVRRGWITIGTGPKVIGGATAPTITEQGKFVLQAGGRVFGQFRPAAVSPKDLARRFKESS